MRSDAEIYNRVIMYMDGRRSQVTRHKTGKHNDRQTEMQTYRPAQRKIKATKDKQI